MSQEIPHVDASRKRILQGGALALLVAGVLLVVAVLPAEYGIDPTGLGAAAGFTRLDESAEPQVEVVDPADVPLARYVATWTLRSTPIHESDGTTRELGETDVEFPVAVENLTRVTATLTWTDEDDAPDEFELSLRAPDGRRSQLVTGTGGDITVDLLWRSVPWPNVTADRAMFDLRGEQDEGTWKAVVRLYNASEAPGEEDTGNAWTLRVFTETWTVDLVRETDLAEGDNVRMVLRPGQDLEYKIHARPGDAFAYAWTATAPLYSDFHAEPDVAPETAESYRAGTRDRDSGSHVAAFPGRHGWYFRNDGAAAVTVTLHTRGTYTLVGVV